MQKIRLENPLYLFDDITNNKEGEYIKADYLIEMLKRIKIDVTLLDLILSPLSVLYRFNLNDIFTKVNENDLNKLAINLSITSSYQFEYLKRNDLDCNIAFLMVRKDYSTISYKLIAQAPSNNIYTSTFGLNTLNKYVQIDFLKNPHLLIAGASGSGKSVLLHSIICSLLLNNYKSIQFVFVDTKRTELSKYEKLPQTDISAYTFHEGLNALKKAIAYMRKIYETLQEFNISHIDELPTTNYIPHTFIVIDELADLILADREEVEQSLITLSQLGRAAGIHLIVATQNPVVRVITALIKANFTTRIALKVASIRDSMNILDHKGAETLTGNGDCIIKYGHTIQEQRFKASYIKNHEINNIVNWWIDIDKQS